MSSTELGVIDQFLADVAAYVGGIYERLAANLQVTFDRVLNGINSLISTITNSLQNVVNNLADVIGDIFGKIEDFISTTINQIVAFIDDILQDIINGISSLISDATRYLNKLTTQIADFIQGLIQHATDFLRDLFDDVVEYLLSIVQKTKQLFTDIFDKVVTEIQAIVDRVKLFFTDIFNTVQAGITKVIGKAGEVVQAITKAIKDFIASVVDVVGNSLRDLLETISNLPDVINKMAEGIIESAKLNIKEPLQSLPLNFINDMVKTISGKPTAELDKLQTDTMSLVFGESPVAQSPEQVRSLIQKYMPENPVIRGVLMLLVAAIVIPQTLGGIASANSQIILQEHALVNPYRIIEPADIVRSNHFGLIEDNLAIEWLRKTGYTESAATMLLQIGEVIPPEAEQINWWLREFIDDSQLEVGLHKKGWSEDSIANLKQAAFFIPPVQDLITMAVREVFTPDIAERFGQFEDFPEDFTKWAKQQGISEEWAKNYWGAHWALPSVQMGFEMLHRDVIKEEDLALLLRASDVMPFWRDKLIDISYSPLTRVDIRRMHKLDVLSVEEVNRAYRDIGYNADNAQRLTDFTIELNKGGASDDPDDLTQLTRSNIIGLYKDGVFKRETAHQLLIDIGLTEGAASLYLEGASLELERQRRKDEINIILDQAEFGSISFDDAQDKLNGLGLETAEITLALTQLQKQEAKRNKLPSKGDLDKMAKKSIISKSEYTETLRRMGYNEIWAKRLTKLL